MRQAPATTVVKGRKREREEDGRKSKGRGGEVRRGDCRLVLKNHNEVVGAWHEAWQSVVHCLPFYSLAHPKLTPLLVKINLFVF